MKAKFLWTINNFNRLSLSNGQSIESNTFTDKYGQKKWCLELYPNGNKRITNNYISLFLIYDQSNGKELQTSFVCAIIDKNGRKVNLSGNY